MYRLSRKDLRLLPLNQRKVILKEFSFTNVQWMQSAPVECIKTYLARTNDIRKSNDAISHLFITTTEPHRNADGDSIANWIKRLMRENGMNSNVHAIRALSSSHALFNGIPEEEILKRGNWKCKETFQKYYLRPALNASNNRVHSVNEIHSRIYEEKSIVTKFISECMRNGVNSISSQPPTRKALSMARVSSKY